MATKHEFTREERLAMQPKLEPGLYRLTKDYVNPSADRRTNDYFKKPELPAGDLFRVTSHTENHGSYDIPYQRVELHRTGLSKVNRYSDRENSPAFRWEEDYPGFLDALERVEDTPDYVMASHRASWVGRDELVDALMATGMLTMAQLKIALDYAAAEADKEEEAWKARQEVSVG